MIGNIIFFYLFAPRLSLDPITIITKGSARGCQFLEGVSLVIEGCIASPKEICR